jgi:acetoin utilization protein AcuB
MNVRDAMTPSPLIVTPRTSVAAALRLIRDNRIAHLPVVERGRMLGVTHSDLLRALILREPEAVA